MKTILLAFKGEENNRIFNRDDINGLSGTWKYLREKLLSIGYDIKTVDDNDLRDCEYLIFFDESSLGIRRKKKNVIFYLVKKFFGIYKKENVERAVYDEAISLGLQDKMSIILWETSSFNPNNYTEENFNRFKTIMTWNDDLVDNKKFFKFLHPYPYRNYKKIDIPFVNKKMLVNISINKNSKHERELYSARRKSISFFEKKLGEQFDLFGFSWNEPVTMFEKILPFLVRKYKSYRGVCMDKNSTLSKYKFSLCYENIQGEKGWITEKIFDCFNANNVPIYWGAENVTKYIPKEAFIDRRNFKSNKDLLKFIESINEEEYKKYLLEIDKFLKSESYKKFLPESFAISIIKALNINQGIK